MKSISTRMVKRMKEEADRWLSDWVKEKNRRMKSFKSTRHDTECLDIFFDPRLRDELEFITSCLHELMGRLSLNLQKEHKEEIKSFFIRTINSMTLVLNDKGEAYER